MKTLTIKLGKWFLYSADMLLFMLSDELYKLEHGRNRPTLQELLNSILARRGIMAAHEAKLNHKDKN